MTPPYPFGSRLLAWPALPNENNILIKVPEETFNCVKLKIKNGACIRAVSSKQPDSAVKIPEDYTPDRLR